MSQKRDLRGGIHAVFSAFSRQFRFPRSEAGAEVSSYSVVAFFTAVARVLTSSSSVPTVSPSVPRIRDDSRLMRMHVRDFLRRVTRHSSSRL